jgi:hypothetical protein
VSPSDTPYTGPRPRVKLSGTDGNAFAILGRMRDALRKAGASREQVQAFLDEATVGDYDNLLATCGKYAEIR